MLIAPLADAMAAPTTNSKGQNCSKTGTERRVGKDQDGNKLDCLFDSCTTCKSVDGKIDCSTQSTEYTNARDCKPVVEPDAGPKSKLFFQMQKLGNPPAVLAPAPSTPKPQPQAPAAGGATRVAPAAPKTAE
jgi:hypothetical protein